MLPTARPDLFSFNTALHSLRGSDRWQMALEIFGAERQQIEKWCKFAYLTACDDKNIN
jgi:hypothetical protein